MIRTIILFLVAFLNLTIINAQSTSYCVTSRFAENDFFSAIAIVNQFDVAYGVNQNVNGGFDTLKMDIHYPNQAVDPFSQRPLVVLVHGGSFISGSKSDLSLYAQQLARRGYVAATIDYRLGWDNIGSGSLCDGNIPQFRYAMYRALQDANAAIRFLAFHSNDYGIDANSIFLLGQSAGAITVLNSAFMDQTEANIIYPGAKADLGTIDSASNNVFAPFQIKGVFNWCGGILDTNIIDANEQIPVLSMHGLLDSLVPVNYGQFLYCNNSSNPYPYVQGPQLIYKHMKNLGLCSEANYDAAGTHCFYPSLEPFIYVPSKYTCFFKNILCGNCITEEKTGYNSQSCMDAAPVSTTYLKNIIQLNVFPNPAMHEVLISITSTHQQTISYTIVNSIGQVVTQNQMLCNVGINTTTLDVSNFTAGIYYLKLNNEASNSYQMIVIE